MTKLQAELDKHKCELADLKHVNSKLRKNNTDKSEELDHRQRKGETSDKEVRALRLRIEQLKSELGEAQDDIDSSTTTNRRLERTNDELNGQLESLQVQVGHLTSRLRSVPTDILSFRRMSRVSAPGGIMSSGFNVLQDVEDTSTDENEFSYAGDEEEDEEDEMVHETDV
jgi:chromosome segregation ATPase